MGYLDGVLKMEQVKAMRTAALRAEIEHQAQQISRSLNSVSLETTYVDFPFRIALAIQKELEEKGYRLEPVDVRTGGSGFRHDEGRSEVVKGTRVVRE